MKKILHHILSAVSIVFDCIYRILCEYSKAVLIVIVLVVSAQVFCRKIGYPSIDTTTGFRIIWTSFSIRWSEEVALLLMVWMAFISMAIGVEKNLHIAISMFFERFPKPVQLVIAKATDILMSSFGCVMIYCGIRLIQTTMKSTLPATKWPACTLYLMIPVSGIFIVYYSLIELFGLQRYKHPNITGNHY